MSKLLLGLLIAAGVIHAAGDPPQDRAQDRAAIRAQIDRIFQAFIHRDSAELRATHAPDWLGYLQGSRTMIHGVDGYMDNSGHFDANYGMTSYKITEFDMVFEGDAAFVAFVADVDAQTPSGPYRRTLRITDFYAKRNGVWIQKGSDTDLHPDTIAKQEQESRLLSDSERKELLDARAEVWRAWFAGEPAALGKILPAELVTIEPHPDPWGNRQSALDGSAQFHSSGGKLVRLEFPKTEFQTFGDTAILYSDYLFEIDRSGQRSVNSGHATEVFVSRNGSWVNTGWHLDNQK